MPDPQHVASYLAMRAFTSALVNRVIPQNRAIMRRGCLVARPKGRPRGLTRQGKRPTLSDKVHRNFNALAPNVFWTADLSEVRTGEGKLYLARVLDMFSRNALAHAFSEHHDAGLAVAALQMAAAGSGGDIDGVIFHSDRGVHR